MERIVEYFREYAPVSNEAWEDFKARLRLDQYRSGAVIHTPEKPCDRIGFILQGIARSYLQKTDGKDFTWFFHYDEDHEGPDEPVYKLGDHLLRLGDYVTIHEADGDVLTYKITDAQDVHG